MTFSRRKIIGSLGAVSGALSFGGCATDGSLPAPGRIDLGRSPKYVQNLFTLGVASGDPLSDGFVIWTRLAPQPLIENGGMEGPMAVRWQVAEDENFNMIVAQGNKTATGDWAHSVHVEVSGLKPLRQYFYRFIADGQDSPTGRAKTAPAYGGHADKLRFAIASCQHYEQGFFNAYHDMVAGDPDLVVHLGDYIYEASWGPQVRRQSVIDAMDLKDYRELHAQYKTDKGLQAAHAHAPWLMIWDDHEVANDYAGINDEHYMPPEQFAKRRAAAYQAYYEHMPVRLRSRPRKGEMRLYDYFYYGNLMTLALTDGRQYRDDQACQTPERGGGQVVTCPEIRDETRSMLGKDQERWLLSSLARTGAEWEVIAQPTLFSKLFQKNREGQFGAWSDGWDGYVGTRNRILNAVAQRRPKNFVSIGGDMHSWWQADLKANYNDPESQTIGTEFVCTSVTSHSYAYNRFKSMLPDNPHINFFDDRTRGYAMIDVTRDTWTVKLREMDDVYSPIGTASTRHTYVIESGKPGAVLA